MSGKRIFSEQEAAEIMQRAVRLQEQSGTGEQYTPGITADELKKIAQEAGIDVAFLEKAIAGLGPEERSKLGLFNLTEEFERVVEGEMNPDDYDRIMNLFSHTQKNGLKQVGRTLSGPAIKGAHMMSLNVESRKGRTKINVKYMPVFAYLIGLHGPMIAGLVGMAGLIEGGQPWLGVGLAVGLLTAGGVAFNALVKAGRKTAKAVTDQIVGVVEEEADPLRSNLHGSTALGEEREKQPDKA
jgi:hypothetical protein